MLTKTIKQTFSSQFLRNVGWLGGAELVNRVFRLATTVTLARTFTPQDYGLVAIIYTVLDFASVFTLKGGIGAKIIQANEEDVKTICDTAYWLNWILCGSLFVIQCIAAFAIAYLSKNIQIFLPLCTVSCMYLMMPLFTVHGALIQRENRLKVTAICNAIQSILSNIITVVLAILGMGIWSVVWAMVLTTPIWIVISWRNHDWRPPKSFQLKRWREIVNFGQNILLLELLSKLRMNLDYLVIANFLGINALGVYYFAFNAGLGISMNVINTFMSALFPYICAVRANYSEFRQRYFSSLKKIALVVVPAILAQSLLAPFYVPIIFGKQWIEAIPVLIMICLSVLPRTFVWAASLLLNAIDKTHIRLYVDIIFTIVFAVSIVVAVNWGIFWVAAAVLISHLIVLPPFIIWIHRYALNEDLHFKPNQINLN
ncbi:oligosaccharide flippase family protein [Scytonema sp. UIC 10036]|uniref:lipopolysaccharide biosynthesis protein n=1 Tax=Scytonema sp. UIC 10036 TaxID=2304196 RepID=UPI0012DA8B9B|nr:lipopolysaccharide biosynthesis protein [Scytonema sp. UIC 10036]MUG99154.1 oligosaccharide flippase family protein [Scytonema sp. UIC 10036]